MKATTKAIEANKATTNTPRISELVLLKIFAARGGTTPSTLNTRRRIFCSIEGIDRADKQRTSGSTVTCSTKGRSCGTGSNNSPFILNEIGVVKPEDFPNAIALFIKEVLR
ncbi:hypothetical protein PIB30_087924 [Stylosanthes scabra]|uniref:Uncharacterized protein n=1 Tax=Stylosanthes scabra TaxID=79078 RepID=A0ABU6TU97_9FABA|nr:hypothetical protein [Stylosanthes scabra]